METLPPRTFKTGESVLAAVQILDTKGQVYMEVGDEAVIMAYYPDKHPTPLTLRKAGEFMNGPWVCEAQLAKNPKAPVKKK
jgi:hypothetical protein